MDTLEESRKKKEEWYKEMDMLGRECCPFKEGDEYWGLNSDGSISRLVWDKDCIDKSVLMLGNAFKTSKEAILEADRRVLLHRFKMFRDKCNGDWQYDWRDGIKWLIAYDVTDGLTASCTVGLNEFSNFGYFKHKSYAEKAIDLFGDEIKRLYLEG